MEIIIFIIGGFFAGVVTGLVGLSAAVIIAPLFATLIGVDPYVAIGIALATDVFASATSAVNYIRYKNVDLKHAWIMASAVVVFTVIASYFSRDTDPYRLGGILNIFVVILGLRFILYPVKGRGNEPFIKPRKRILLQSLIWGIAIGLISGWFGSGGGLSMLAVLTMLLGYQLKEAVGTSVFIMTFVAFVGALTHIIIGGTDWIALLIASAAALVGANISSIFANNISNKRLNQVIGGFLIVYGTVLVLIYFI